MFVTDLHVASRFIFTAPSISIYIRRYLNPLRHSSTSKRFPYCRYQRYRGFQMTIGSEPVIKNGSLIVRGKVVLTGVPNNVVASSDIPGSAFIGASTTFSASHHVFDLGVLEDFKFLCLFIAKIWWMIPRVGKSASEIPLETQMLLLEVIQESFIGTIDEEIQENSTTGNKFYVLLLPFLDGAFRTTLQGTSSNQLQFCYESGDPQVQTSRAMEAVFVSSGDNPFELIRDSIKKLAKHKGTFSHLDSKKIPCHLDWFGWCTWDAFYSDVSPKGIKDGLESFKNGGISPKFLIIDDGWQETVNEFQEEQKAQIEGIQFATRLTDIKENSKFRGSEADDLSANLKQLIHHIKENYGLKYVYAWHALAGYWGGVLPSSETLKKYNPKLEYPILSPGNIGNIRDIALDSLEKYGVGLVDPKKINDFYNDMHTYLASCGIDGVKVDVQTLLETLGSTHGGRVSITKQFHQALEESVEKNFMDNNLICCMSHNTDSIFSSKKSATARASEDFMPNEPAFQTLHIASVCFNSLLLGEIFVPDWDMFHSNHSTAEFHGAARAIGGCPVYVSDKPGKHDFNILKKLVLSDGTILRARYAGRPTRDCLFIDPVMDGKSLLKIWNLNKLTGVVGIFNCQGAGSWLMKQPSESTPNSKPTPEKISGSVSPNDVEFLEEISDETWNEKCAVYSFNSGSLSVIQLHKTVEVSLGVIQCEILTISPIKELNASVQFAPVGLINMYNSGGAVEDCSFDNGVLKIKARGTGLFGAYSNTKPISCKVNERTEEYFYRLEDGLMTVNLPSNCGLQVIEISF